MPQPSDVPGICRRIGQIREELYGPRGKAGFAKELGLSPSTYSYYEIDRVPPAELLVKVADLAGVCLRWLLTGVPAEPAIASDHPAVRRIAAFLADRPDSAGPLLAFLDLLAETTSWPDKDAPPRRAAVAAAPSDAPPAQHPVPSRAGKPQQDWIPILGRSAAGVPQFWLDAAEDRGATPLTDLIARHARRSRRQIRRALATDEAGRQAGVAQVITLTAPDADNPAEFVAAPPLKASYPDAFAVRIDGDSMSPEIRHGDLVVCSPSAPAADGRPAVVQLRGQIGVTCKIYRAEADTVHLVPVNEQYPPQSFPREKAVWALRVLARIRME